MKSRQLNIDKKTGFTITNNSVPVIINDYRGKLFYDNSELIKKKSFNLPEGKYYIISGHFRRLINPIEYTLNRLPFPQRFRKNPVKFKIVFRENPHKATIDWNNEIIIFDTKLRNLGLPELNFILYHEYAHSRYKTESYADALAENIMLKKGYNPSQISKSPIIALSEKQYRRKQDTIERLYKR